MDKIILNDVSIGYRKKVVAEGLTTELRGGEFTCLVGRNGLGKSTLLKVLAGFDKPLSGNISLNIKGKDYDLTKLSKTVLARFVSVVLTDRIEIANVTAKEVVGMGRMPYTGFFGKLKKEDKDIVDTAMGDTGIEELAEREINTLSDGERQKVMIARALAQQTPIILLDEPTAFLDYESKVSTMQLLHELAHDKGKIILASTHDLDIAVRYADRLITINNGIVEPDLTVLLHKPEIVRDDD